MLFLQYQIKNVLRNKNRTSNSRVIIAFAFDLYFYANLLHYHAEVLFLNVKNGMVAKWHKPVVVVLVPAIASVVAN